MFGGSAGPPPREFNDAWMWDGTKWEALRTPPGPAPRSDGSLISDAKTRRLILVGGYDGHTMFRDAWSLENSGWKPLP